MKSTSLITRVLRTGTVISAILLVSAIVYYRAIERRPRLHASSKSGLIATPPDLSTTQSSGSSHPPTTDPDPEELYGSSKAAIMVRSADVTTKPGATRRPDPQTLYPSTKSAPIVHPDDLVPKTQPAPQTFYPSSKADLMLVGRDVTTQP
jgi:hypothetical protein